MTQGEFLGIGPGRLGVFVSTLFDGISERPPIDFGGGRVTSMALHAPYTLAAVPDGVQVILERATWKTQLNRHRFRPAIGLQLRRPEAQAESGAGQRALLGRRRRPNLRRHRRRPVLSTPRLLAGPGTSV